MVNNFDYVFSENGLVAFKDGEEFHRQNLKVYMGEEKLTKFINFCLHFIADAEVPVKRGTFVEFRNGMINVSPCGRNVNQEERVAFGEWDKENKLRELFVEALEEECKGDGWKFSIGGQISFDVFPEGWDKTYCLQHVAENNYKEIHFFGDKTYVGGNDYEIFMDERTQGHTTTGPEDTVTQCKELFM
eukprot:TRINITY_DN1296_c1_g2_i1.p2 TRINITY_DN1296_c1_g2~~TRINITY_DN1296_c1_g2_i1.p2  ORF type:complete len:188 (+),score=67.25 TRINITY_DN1296_c1_g2_i1:206-769(+)